MQNLCIISWYKWLTNCGTNGILISETRKERKQRTKKKLKIFKEKHLTRYKEHDIISA